MATHEQRTSPDTPEAALKELLTGNSRYVDGSTQSENPPEARAELAAGQSPFAAVVRCADSRVAPEIVFDQSLGALFVCGVAGNLPTPEVIASLEYGVAVLGCKAILIMGHSGCGAVTAAMEHRHDPSELPGSLPHLIGQIVPVCMQPEGEVSLEAAIANNAKAGAQQLLRGSHIISDAVGAGDVGVYAGVQDVASGRFSLVE